MEELKRGGGRGGAAGRARGARAGGIGVAVWCSAGGARAVQCVAAAAREVSEGESEAKRERGPAWPVGLSHGPKLTPVGLTPSRLELS